MKKILFAISLFLFSSQVFASSGEVIVDQCNGSNVGQCATFGISQGSWYGGTPATYFSPIASGYHVSGELFPFWIGPLRTRSGTTYASSDALIYPRVIFASGDEAGFRLGDSTQRMFTFSAQNFYSISNFSRSSPDSFWTESRTFSINNGKIKIGGIAFCLYANIDGINPNSHNFNYELVARSESLNCEPKIGYTYFNLSGSNPSSATCSDGIKNQNETDIDFGGTCACYSKDTVTGQTLLPFLYAGTFTEKKVSSFIADYERVTILRNGYTNSDITATKNNYDAIVSPSTTTGSLRSVLEHTDGAIASFDSQPTITIKTYPSPTFGDPKTVGFSQSGSNAVNYVRLLTDTPWHLEAKIIRNTAFSGSVNNVEDSDYTRIDSFSGVAYLERGWVSRDFRIVFDSLAPTIYSIDWGSYTRTASTNIVCPVSNAPETIIEAQNAYINSLSGSTLVTITSGNGTIDKWLSDTGILKSLQAFLNLVSFYVPTEPNMTVSIVLPKWYSNGKIGAQSYTGTLVPITDKANITQFAPNPIKKPLVVLFSILFYVIFSIFVIGVLTLLPLMVFKIVSKITQLFIPFIDGSQGNFASLVFLIPFALSYFAIIVAFLPLYANVTQIFIVSKTYVIAIISLINNSWGSYAIFSTTINLVLTLVYATIGGTIVYKLADKYLRVN